MNTPSSLPGQCCALCSGDLGIGPTRPGGIPGLCRSCVNRLEMLTPGSSNSIRPDSGILLCGVYSGTLAEIIIRYKKGYDRRLSKTIAGLFITHLSYLMENLFIENRIAIEPQGTEQGSQKLSVLLTHPPGSRKSRLYRGYDHMQRICNHLLKWLDSPFVYSMKYRQLLTRTCSTAQKSLSREERLVNVNISFQLNTKRISREMGKIGCGTTHVVLLDDVVTTGATLIRSRQLLYEAGFQHITALALASD